MFRQLLDEPDGPFAAQILEKVPAVLRSRGVGEPAGAEGLPDADQLCSGRRRAGSRAILRVHSVRTHSGHFWWMVPVRDACGCAWTGSPAGRPGQRCGAGCPDMLDTNPSGGCERPVRRDRMAAHAGQSYWQCPRHSDREKDCKNSVDSLREGQLERPF